MPGVFALGVFLSWIDTDLQFDSKFRSGRHELRRKCEALHGDLRTRANYSKIQHGPCETVHSTHRDESVTMRSQEP